MSKKINPDPRITADAIEHLANWALKQIPPLSVIAACDRALWWVGQARKPSPRRVECIKFHHLEIGDRFQVIGAEGGPAQKIAEHGSGHCDSGCRKYTGLNARTASSDFHACPDTSVFVLPF